MNESVEKLLSSLSTEDVEELLKQIRQRVPSHSNPVNARGIKMRIQVTEGSSLKPSNRPKTPPRPEDEPTIRALAKLTPGLREAFINAEPKVLSWLRSSRQNRTRFLLDPVSALKEAVPEFDQRLIQEIESLRAASGRTTPDIPGLKLDSLELEVAGVKDGEKQ